MPTTLRIATRGSALARWQADHVASLLRARAEADGRDLDVTLEIVRTEGDRDRSRPIWEMGGKGVFVKEVQAAVLEGRADLAVHSAKDLPSMTPAELVIGAVPERADPRDVLVGSRLDDLGPGARIGTGSIRRRAQLAWLRPDLTFAGLRGNIATRLERAGDFDAIVVAAAALDRLGLTDHAADVLDPALLLPQVGQGALAIECRASDGATRELLACIEHGVSRRAVDAERAFLAELGGDCDLPAAAHAVVDPGSETVSLEALVASLDGRKLVRDRRTGDDPADLGHELGRELAPLLTD